LVVDDALLRSIRRRGTVAGVALEECLGYAYFCIEDYARFDKLCTFSNFIIVLIAPSQNCACELAPNRSGLNVVLRANFSVLFRQLVGHFRGAVFGDLRSTHNVPDRSVLGAGSSDPYVVVELQPSHLFPGQQPQQTTVVKTTLNPSFNETFSLYDNSCLNHLISS